MNVHSTDPRPPRRECMVSLFCTPSPRVIEILCGMDNSTFVCIVTKRPRNDSFTEEWR